MRIFALVILLSWTAMCTAQDASSSGDTNKYRINLPAFWKPGNKAWRILNEKLPEVCDELKNKDLCGGSCKAMYTVDFELTEPTILDYYAQRITGSRYEFITLYTFQCNMYVRNRDNVITSHIILVDTNEVFQVKTSDVLREYESIPRPPKVYLKKLSNTQSEVIIVSDRNELNRSYGSYETPSNYINKNKVHLTPKEANLYDEVDKKIKALDH